jgi:aromatic ring-opening dioxygenase catalytic subunit (LigB family)
MAEVPDELTWPVDGDPDLATEVRRLLAEAGIETASQTGRGLDHGVFVPLRVAFPHVTVPVVQLSLVRGLEPSTHLEVGAALEPLREEGVLVVGSGMSYHNVDAFMTEAAAQDSATFDTRLAEACTAEPGERRARLLGWEDAPVARRAHPREEHLAPLFVVVGAAGTDPGVVSFRGNAMGATLSGHVFG